MDIPHFSGNYLCNMDENCDMIQSTKIAVWKTFNGNIAVYVMN